MFGKAFNDLTNQEQMMFLGYFKLREHEDVLKNTPLKVE